MALIKQNTIQLPDFSDLHILVIGDVMIDRYISGSVKRISPEAPVPVVEMQKCENRLGGAANVALNIHALGAEVTILSIIGADKEGKVMQDMLATIPKVNDQILILPERKTTIKSRVMSGNQHLLRIDSEDTYDVSGTEEDNIIFQLKKILSTQKIDGIILQDYNKGMLTERIIHQTISMAIQFNIPTFVDPKEKNFFAYRGCTVFKPNKKEVFTALGDGAFHDLDKQLKEKLNNKVTLITLGSQGLYISDERSGHKYETDARIIADVCGAGDSVISIVCLCYIKGMPIDLLAYIANTAGGQVCEQPGVVAINLTKLKSELLYKSE